MALFVRAAFTVIIVRMECGFPFLFSFNPFKIHLQTRKDLGHRLFDLVDFARRKWYRTRDRQGRNCNAYVNETGRVRIPIARRFLDRLRLLWLDKTIRYAAIEISGETRAVSGTTMVGCRCDRLILPVGNYFKDGIFDRLVAVYLAYFRGKEFFLSKENYFELRSKYLVCWTCCCFFCNDLLAGTLLGQFYEIVNVRYASIVELLLSIVHFRRGSRATSFDAKHRTVFQNICILNTF